MEFVQVNCTDTDYMLDRLNVFGAFWESRRMFDQMTPLWNTVWRSSIETLAVFLYGARTANVILKVEYVRDSPTCKIEIVSVVITSPYSSPGDPIPSNEVIAKELLIDLFSIKQEDLHSFALDHDLIHLLASEQSVTGVFECPHCGAKYAKRRLKRQPDGSVRCQNCNMWIPPTPSGPEERQPV